jgi:hypothetical protein
VRKETKLTKYLVRVKYEYPVDAVNAEDALSTVPIATRLKYANADGLTEIINDEGKTVLRAKLVNNSKKEEN